MLGLRRGSVQLVPYTPAWSTLFEAERARLHHAVHPHALDIQHIGRTAAPNLPPNRCSISALPWRMNPL